MEKRALLVSYHYYPDTAVGAKRPTELARSLQSEGWEVDVLTLKLSRENESERKRVDVPGNVFGIYQHPGIVNPLWAWIKRFKSPPQHIEKTDSDNQNARASADHLELEAPKKATDSSQTARLKQPNENLKQRLKRYLISAQATLNACKSWAVLGMLQLLMLKLQGRRYQLIVSSSPPAVVHILALTAKMFFRSKWVLDLRDPISLWEEVLPVCISQPRVAIENYLEKKYLSESDAVVVTTPGLKADLSNQFDVREDKISVVYNGYDKEMAQSSPLFDGCMKLVYAGSLYMNRNPFPFFEAIHLLMAEGDLNRENICFDLYGDCEKWNGRSTRQWIAENRLEGVININGFISPQELEPYLESAHLLVSFAQSQPKQIPAKTFDYLAYRCKSIVVTESGSATGQFIAANGFGYVVDADAKMIGDSIIKEYKLLSLSEKSEIDEISRKQYSREFQNNKYLSVINKLIGL